jgi:polyferredoxin
MTATIRKKNYSITKSRHVIQWMVVIGTLLIGLRHIMPGEASRGGSFDSFCAFGGIETLLPYLFTGRLLKSTNLLNFSVLIATLGVSLVAGRAFCGWLCGLGAIQDFIAEWTRKLLGEKQHIRGKRSKTILPLNLPASIDRPLRYAKYLVLFWIMVGSLYTAYPPLREFCPVRAVFGLHMTTLLWVTLAVFIAGSVLVERFWCKYLCPLGATLAVFNKISPVQIVSDSNHCNNCGRCDIECSMGIKDVPLNLDDPECTRCLDCMETCARDGSLELKVFKR